MFTDFPYMSVFIRDECLFTFVKNAYFCTVKQPPCWFIRQKLYMDGIAS